MVVQGQAVQILRWAPSENENEPLKLFLDKPALFSVLNQIGDRPVSIISIGGPSKTGKSLLLSTLTSYLKTSIESKQNWNLAPDVPKTSCATKLENNDDDGDDIEVLEFNKPMEIHLEGFYFESTGGVVTRGVWLSPSPIRLPDRDILLMDTHGLFEEETSLREWNGILGAALLLSSCSIYNVSRLLQDDTLIFLQTVVEQLSMLKEQPVADGSSNSMFNSSEHLNKLLFLVRDWNNPKEFPYGNEGGHQFLNKLFDQEVSKKSQKEVNMREESVRARHVIRSSFKEVAAFLLPYPGESINDLEFLQTVLPNEIDLAPEFITCLQEFLSGMGNPDNLRNLSTFSALGFVQQVENYVDVFNKTFTETTFMHDAALQRYKETTISNAVRYYEIKMKETLDQKSKPKLSYLPAAHKKIQDYIMTAFKKRRTIGNEAEFAEYTHQLELAINKSYGIIEKEYHQKREVLALQVQEATLAEIVETFKAESDENLDLPVSSETFNSTWNAVKASVKEKYLKLTGNMDPAFQQQYEPKFGEKLRHLYDTIRSRNEARLTAFMADQEEMFNATVTLYDKSLEHKLTLDSFEAPEVQQQKYNEVLKEAQDFFLKKSSIPNSLPDLQNEYSMKLESILKTRMQVYLEKNDAKFDQINQLIHQIITNSIAIYDERIKSNPQSSPATDPQQWNQLHQLASKDAANHSYTEFEENSEIFGNNVKIYKNLQDSLHHQLESKLKHVLLELKNRVEDQNNCQQKVLEDSYQIFHQNSTTTIEKEKEKFQCLQEQQLLQILRQAQVDASTYLRHNLGPNTPPNVREQIEKELHNTISEQSKSKVTQNELWLSEARKQLRKIADSLLDVFKTRVQEATPSTIPLPSTALRVQSDFKVKIGQITDEILQTFSSSATSFRPDLVESSLQYLMDQIKTQSFRSIKNLQAKIVHKGDEERLKFTECFKSTITKYKTTMTQQLKKFDHIDENYFKKVQMDCRKKALNFFKDELAGNSLTTEGDIDTECFDVVTNLEVEMSRQAKEFWRNQQQINEEFCDEIQEKVKQHLSQLKNYLQKLKTKQDVQNNRKIHQMDHDFVEELSEFSWTNDENKQEVLDNLSQEIEAVKRKRLEQLVKEEDANVSDITKRITALAITDELKDLQAKGKLSKDTTEQTLAKHFHLMKGQRKQKEHINDNSDEDFEMIEDPKTEKERRDLDRIARNLIRDYQKLLPPVSSRPAELKTAHHTAVEIIKNKYQVQQKDLSKNTELLLEIEKRLMDDVQKLFYEQLAEIEQRGTKKKTDLPKLLEQATEFYRIEMTQNFEKVPHYNPSRLTQLHSTAAQNSISKIPRASYYNEDIPLFHQSFDQAFKEFDARNKMNTPTSYAIGIDLGTTYSCIGCYTNGKVEIIPNEFNNKTTPSFVSFAQLKDGRPLVGQEAKDQAHVVPEKTIYEVKRLIGRKFDDPSIKEDIAKWPFKVVQEVGRAKVLIDDKTYFAEEISSEILYKLKTIAEKYLKEPVTAAVITVPAYFTENQRAATKSAGEAAGLEVLRIINEPTAAAIAYNLNLSSYRGLRKGLVFDMGGGTFDVAIFSAAEGQIDVLNVGGDTHLGGVDFDNAMVQHCITEFNRQTGVNLVQGRERGDLKTKSAVNRKLMRLKAICEKNKVNLTGGEKTTIAVDGIHKDLDLSVTIDRTTFEGLIDHHLQAAIKCVQTTLKECGLSKTDIDDVILVGGSTRVPKVRQMLSTFFGKELNTSVNPDEAVAIGAAFEAAVLNGAKALRNGDTRAAAIAPKGMSIKDVMPMSYGIEVDGGLMSILIKKQSRIPIAVTNTYCTMYNNQTSVQIVIFEGDNPRVKNNTMVGEFYLNGIPPGKAGAYEVAVTMAVSLEGLLKVTAACTCNGVQKQLTVRANKTGNSGGKIKLATGR